MCHVILEKSARKTYYKLVLLSGLSKRFIDVQDDVNKSF